MNFYISIDFQISYDFLRFPVTSRSPLIPSSAVVLILINL